MRGGLRGEEGGGGGRMERRGCSLLLEFALSAKAALLCQEGFALEEPSMFQ